MEYFFLRLKVSVNISESFQNFSDITKEAAYTLWNRTCQKNDSDRIRHKLILCERVSFTRKMKHAVRLLRFSYEHDIRDSHLMNEVMLLAIECMSYNVLTNVRQVEYLEDIDELKSSLFKVFKTTSNFFLEHARIKRLTICNRRLPDLLLSMLRQQGYRGMTPALMCQILRYGTVDLLEVTFPCRCYWGMLKCIAKLLGLGEDTTMGEPCSSCGGSLKMYHKIDSTGYVSIDHTPPCTYYQSMPLLDHPMLDILAHIINKLHKHSFKRAEMADSDYKFKGYLDFFRPIMRSLDRLPTKGLSRINGETFRIEMKDSYLTDILDLVSDQEKYPTRYCPELADQLGSKVTKLKRLCRTTIRRSLYKSWNLPNGIFKLGLCEPMERLLNLE